MFFTKWVKQTYRKSTPSLKRMVILLAGFLLVVIITWIPYHLAVARLQSPQPQAILVLGGDYSRTEKAAALAMAHRDLPIWVSDYPRYYRDNRRIMRTAGVDSHRVHYDFCATDTVTNFTCMLPIVTQHGFHHLYLVTSDFHLRRSLMIATLIFGSRGIWLTPVAVPSDTMAESWIKVLRDVLRSLIWLLTGQTGAELNPTIERFQVI